MRRYLIIIVFVFSSLSMYSQHSFISYYDLKDFMQASPGSFKYGLYGFNNPAATTYLNCPDVMVVLSGLNDELKYPMRWGAFFGNPSTELIGMNLPSTGWGIIRDADSSQSVYDFRYSWGFGDKIYNFGVGYGFSFGDVSHFNRSGIIYFGGLLRPFRQLSIGAQRTFVFDGTDGETVAELAVRPIGSYPLTFYADAGMFDSQNLKEANWSAGISWEVLDGFRLNGRYFKDKTFTVGIDLSFGKFGIGSISGFDKDQKYGYNSYTFRAGADDRTFIDKLGGDNFYMQMDLKGEVKYQGFLWFDKSNKLINIIDKIDAAKKDNTVKGLIINASGMSANMELAWEIREKLKEFRESGKKIIMFIERVGLSDYQFASIADKIVMDPLGSVALSGYAMGRSYHKKMLDDLGIGFQELRFFKYKSAYENFERNDMSEGDREQRQKLLDDWYEFSRSEICESRGLSNDTFDSLVDSNILFTAEAALEKKLVDTLARWNDMKEILKAIDKDSKLKPPMLVNKINATFDDKWGQNSKSIAVIYALGACAMDQGIKARELSAYLKKVAESKVGAIVIRVDSPGGDGMASDVVAEIIRNFKGKKPIIISQGAVAASGGYWLSMDADTIVAAPMTITGSIGVIGGWFYDKGLSDSIGINTEILKRGKYADLGYPFTLPFIPIGLPARNLNEDERSQMEKYIRGHYKDFVTKVSVGRGMSYDSVHDVAQGRVWSGIEGKKRGLVDILGGLDMAINIAKEKAGYDIDDEVQIFQYPEMEMFDWTSILSMSLGLDLKQTKNQFDLLKFRIDNNGVPLPMMPIDYFHFVQDE